MQDPNWRLCKEVLATNVRQVLSTGQITFLHAHPGLQPPSTWQNKQQCSWDGALSVHVVGSWVAGSDPGQGPRYHFLYWKSAGGGGGPKNQICNIDLNLIFFQPILQMAIMKVIEVQPDCIQILV